MQRDLEGFERRRLRAAALFQRGWTQAEVARHLRVSRTSASRWARLWEKGGNEALRRSRHTRSKLTPAQLRRIQQALWRAPRAHGYDAKRWSALLVADLILRRTGVTYHPGHVSRMRKSLRW